ncbi:MAG: hypothetical protein M0Q90_05955 [Bacteroidales bacterium]|nr:hypothetical protein [Bacteroidales bacterium]
MFSEAKSRSEAFAGNGRVYDPLIGHVLSPDPFIQQPEYSQSYNRYGYVFNNPLRYTDPSGYFASGDTTGKQQNNAESILIRQAREDQQKERLSYNTDESTDGPGVNQLQVEGEKGQGLGQLKWCWYDTKFLLAFYQKKAKR